ncbi:META domain-containing protein [Leptothoe sp. EHU-05/26/07-4]
MKAPLTYIISLAIVIPLPISPATAVAQAVKQLADNPFTDKVWQLQEVVYSNDESITIQDPSRYTLDFRSNGQIGVLADCNFGGGSYSYDNDRLTINLNGMTRAGCSDHYSYEYSSDLHSVESFDINDGRLYLNLRDVRGVLVFEPDPSF